MKSHRGLTHWISRILSRKNKSKAKLFKNKETAVTYISQARVTAFGHFYDLDSTLVSSAFMGVFIVSCVCVNHNALCVCGHRVALSDADVL